MAHWQDTPGHAWLYLSPTELARLPEIARRPSYEEDVEWAITVLALPELAENKKLFGGGKEATLKLARKLCRDYYPEIFEQLTGEKATPENSYAAQKPSSIKTTPTIGSSSPRTGIGKKECPKTLSWARLLSVGKERTSLCARS